MSGRAQIETLVPGASLSWLVAGVPPDEAICDAPVSWSAPVSAPLENKWGWGGKGNEIPVERPASVRLEGRVAL